MSDTEGMGVARERVFRAGRAVVGAALLLVGARHVATAGKIPGVLLRAFTFPMSFSEGVSGDLVAPAGAGGGLTFGRGMVAIGYLPIPLPEQVDRRRRGRTGREFVHSTDTLPHARLFLDGVVDANGKPVTNSGNQLLVEALISPSSAGSGAPPFAVTFEIHDGTAFLDVPLTLHAQREGPVRVQILGVEVVDQDGQPFGVLGFQLIMPPPSPVPSVTPAHPGMPEAEGQCYAAADCTGPSFAASQRRCCHAPLAPQSTRVAAAGSWCPPDQFDATTGQCLSNACLACAPGAAAEDCGERAACGGACAVVCTDGGSVRGQCVADENQRCACSATCKAATPCAVGQCFDTVGLQCTGQACGPGQRCGLPNQFCDLSGRHCACSSTPPAPPHSRICCQCQELAPACFTVPVGEVQPVCPPGCETFVGQECNAEFSRCVPPSPCSADRDCDDENGCTIDQCAAGACAHDCVCAGQTGCGPGPAPQ